MLWGLFSKKAGKTRPDAIEPPAPAVPLQLSNGPVSFLVGFTTRRAVEARLGPAVEYPAPGWRTWAAAGRGDECWILSAIYRDGVLIGVEHYLGKTDTLPRSTPPANGVFCLVPGGLGIGSKIAALPDRFVSAAGPEGGPRSLVYQHAYESRWAHGLAVVSGNGGRIERIALYVDGSMPTLRRTGER